MTTRSRDAASAPWREAVYGRTRNAVAEVMSAKNLALGGRNFKASDSSRALNATSTLGNTAALGRSTRDIVSLISASMRLTVCSRYEDAVAIRHTAGTSRSCSHAIDRRTRHTSTRKCPADILAFGRRRVDALPGRQTAGTFAARPSALNLTARNVITHVYTAVLSTLSGRYHDTATRRQTTSPSGRQTRVG